MEIHSYKQKSFVPTHLITIYCRDGSDHAEKYLEITEVIKNTKPTKQNPKPFILGNSSPADAEFLRDLVSTIKAENFEALQFKGIIPSNVLYFKSIDESPILLWYRESETRRLVFSDELGMESGEYIMPKILFSVKHGELSVFRIDEDTFNDTTILNLVPLPNIHDDSTVCLGNGSKKQKKSKCLEDVIANYEELFYNTRFNVFHNDTYFPIEVEIKELSKNKDIRQWPVKKSDYKNFKQLFNEIA